MAYKIVLIVIGLTAVLLYRKAPTRRGRERKGSK